MGLASLPLRVKPTPAALLPEQKGQQRRRGEREREGLAYGKAKRGEGVPRHRHFVIRDLIRVEQAVPGCQGERRRNVEMSLDE